MYIKINEIQEDHLEASLCTYIKRNNTCRNLKENFYMCVADVLILWYITAFAQMHERNNHRHKNILCVTLFDH